MRKPSRVPTSCNPVEVVLRRRSTGVASSIGAGAFQARPGSVMTRVTAPNRVTTIASPAGAITAHAAIAAPKRSAAAKPKRCAAGSQPARLSSTPAPS